MEGDTEHLEMEEGMIIETVDEKMHFDIGSIANSDKKLLEICTSYSASVIESIILLLKQPDFLDDRLFLQNLKNLIIQYNVSPLLPSPFSLLSPLLLFCFLILLLPFPLSLPPSPSSSPPSLLPSFPPPSFSLSRCHCLLPSPSPFFPPPSLSSSLLSIPL